MVLRLFLKSILVLSLFFVHSLKAQSRIRIKLIIPAAWALLDPPPSIDPDANNMRLGKLGPRWNNNVGGEFGLIRFQRRKMFLGIVTGGFVNIHDYDSKQAFSWQLWRGNINSRLVLENLKFDTLIGKNSRLSLETGWAHESQHATDLIGYCQTFTYWYPYFFPNGSLRSFNYIKSAVNYTNHSQRNIWQLDIRAGYKHFYAPNIDNAVKMMNHSVFCEAGIQRKIITPLFAYAKGYFENINNNFVSSDYKYKNPWNKQPFIYRIIELGFYFKNQAFQKFNPYFMYSHSNGRGMDFITVYKSFGAGLRVTL